MYSSHNSFNLLTLGSEMGFGMKFASRLRLVSLFAGTDQGLTFSRQQSRLLIQKT